MSVSRPVFTHHVPLERTATGVTLRFADHHLRLEVLTSNIVRVAASPAPAFFNRQSFAVLPRSAEKRAPFAIESPSSEVILTTSELSVRVDLETGAVAFHDARSGQAILREAAGGRSFTPREEQGEAFLAVRQHWEPSSPREAIYGLGQHQFGLMNIRGRDLDL